MAILTIDPNRLPAAIATAAAKSRAATNHIGINVYAVDTTGALGQYDVADLDAASIEAWLSQIKDLLKRARLRHQLERIRVPPGATS
jgi:hypothetical protein